MKPEPVNPTAIVLAAGKGERYDGLKQLAKIYDRPVLQYVLDAVRQINWKFKPLLVLGYKADRIINAVDSKGFRVIENNNWKHGMSTSLKMGVSETPDTSCGFVFFLADMPLVRPSIIEEVLEKAADGYSIVAPSYQGKRGFPVYIDRKWENQLLNDVTGDKGAREIIDQNRQDLTLIKTEDRGVITDLNKKDHVSRIESYLVEEGTEIVI